ncbi:MAG: hypothetical protein ACPL4E_03060 [Thermoproteota archaeon]
MKCRESLLKVLPVVVCREEEMKEVEFKKSMEELKKNISKIFQKYFRFWKSVSSTAKRISLSLKNVFLRLT